MRAAVLVIAVVLLCAACGAAAQESAAPAPREGRSGLHLSGTVDGRHVAVSDGLPQLVVRGCNVRHDIPAAVCFVTRNLDGAPVVVGLANPEVVAAQDRLGVERARCDGTVACGEVDDHAVVFVRIGDTVRQPSGGSVALTELDEGQRYVGELRLQFGSGRLSGSFDVVPRPEPGSGGQG